MPKRAPTPELKRRQGFKHRPHRKHVKWLHERDKAYEEEREQQQKEVKKGR